MNENDTHHRAILQDIADMAMLERGMLPDFSAKVKKELNKIQAPAKADGENLKDLRDLLWASIDNDDSEDLDQITVAIPMPEERIKVLVAVADVDSIVKKGSAIDQHASKNTASVYTAAKIYPMLPEKLSTNLTSLNLNQDRIAVVIEMVIGPDGSLEDSDVYRAVVRNHAKLAYKSVGAWLEGRGPVPEAATAVRGMEDNLRLQDRAAQRMKDRRMAKGALCLQTIESKPVFEDEIILDLEVEEENRAMEVIEEFMVAANGVTVRYLSSKNIPSIRRVVRTPKRWERIVEIAAERGFSLPKSPDSKALEEFLISEKAADPVRFPDLSLAIIKLLGAGEYVAELPGEKGIGHFGLAVRDYAHSTAPNRRYPDLVTQRLLKAAIDGKPQPYGNQELENLAAHCTERENKINKVERQVGKSAAALLLQSRIGEQFEAIVTGAAPKGTWARLIDIPVEGMLKDGYPEVDVGDMVRVQLVSVDVERGFIDFKRIGDKSIKLSSQTHD